MNGLFGTGRDSSIASKDLVDPLTGIRNRRGFLAAAEPLLDACRKTDLPLVLLEIEVAAFADISSEFGPSSAEALLRASAGLINTMCRSGDLVGRTGVAQFSILLPGASIDLAEQVAGRLTRAARRLSETSRNNAMRHGPLALETSTRYVSSGEAFAIRTAPPQRIG